MYSNDRYRIPATSPGRRYSDQRMLSGSRLPPDPRDSIRPQPRERRSLESDRRGIEIDRRDRNESLGRRSQEFDYNHGRQPERRDFERNRMEDEGKRKMAEELKIREQQLAITSNLLQKQSEMLKNIEANMMARNQPGPSPMMGRNMVPPRLHMGPMDRRPDTRSPRRKFEFNNDMDKSRYDGPPPKRFKEIEQGERSNWNKAVQSRGGSHMKGGPSQGKVCNICKSPNHFARDCSDNTMIDNGKVCNICKSPNHFQRSCPQNSLKDHFSGPKHDMKRPPVGLNNKPFGTTSRFAGTRGGRRPFQSDRFRGKFAGNNNIRSCKICSIHGIRDFETHIKTPEHARMFDLCKAGCKLCSKKRYNSKPQYEKHQVSTLHKAVGISQSFIIKILVSKKKLVVESKLKPYSASNTSGVEYVVPVAGFFCKLCKKFYNKESYAKDDHCKTKAHYDKVASMIGTKFETAIGARFQGLKDKLSSGETDQQQLERKLIEAVRKADFVTDLKPIPDPKKTVAPKTPAATTEKTTEAEKAPEDTEKHGETSKAPAEDTVKTEEEDKTEETSEDTKETEDESEEKPAEDDGDHEHPDDLEMEVLDDAGGDDAAGPH
ncbi:hypothetical protein LOTGIDRAFT_231367 [Lottia gigantea]|uniref:Matrin-type domain-containing protein n=1 Tax=Lottia gigantea TaxID=225164 RepID=V4ATN4_LOTGI|nr:hypothetical protein LOTGIDRAFT_231367 [Lottia gigantea]ESO98275.1 hypothetical protein LOTGIDRAFT_231367 [Lottia gigantea]